MPRVSITQKTQYAKYKVVHNHSIGLVDAYFVEVYAHAIIYTGI